MKLTKKAKKGFTLVELIVVIAIIAILAAVSVAGYYGFINSANKSAADQEAAQIKNVIRAAAMKGIAKDEVLIKAETAAEGETQKPDTVASYAYTWDANGLKVSNTENLVQATVLTDLVNIVKGFGGLDLNDTDGKNGKLALTETIANVKETVITTAKYTSAKNFESEISFLN